MNKKKEEVLERPIDAALEEMFCYSMRYSLGRHTYAPYSVTEFLRPLLPRVRAAELEIWARDIEEAYPPEEAGLMGVGVVGGYSDRIDRDLWMRFLEDIRRELRRREEGTKDRGVKNETKKH